MQKNSKKVLSACSVATLLIAGTTLPATVKADSSSNVTRIGGADRYETAAKVADAGWTSSSYAIVANGEGYADALCATPLAKAKNAPILLTYGNSLNQNVLDQLKNLKVEHVIVVGGTGVVPDSVVDEIKAQVSDVQRLGGQDRYETSVKIADALGTKPTKAVVASGEGYADALSAGPAAAINGIPILLTTQNTLPDAETNYLKANSNITATYVIGETGSVSDSVKDSLPSPTRLGGADRYETNIAVLKEFKSDFGFGNVYAALGNGPVGNEFADALTGGALAAKNKNPLIITGLSLSSATTDFLDENVPKNSTLTILGGTGNISDSFADSIKGSFGAGTTSGGGGGSDTKSYPLAIKDYLDNNVDYLNEFNNDENINKYVTISTEDTSDAHTINAIFSSSNNPIKDAFENAETSEKIDEKIADVQNQIDDISSGKKLGTLTIGGDNLKTFLGNLDSKYIDKDGNLNSVKIKEEIQERSDGNQAYGAFRDELETRINQYFAAHSDKAQLGIKVKGYTLYSVTNGTATVYDGNDSKSIVDLLLPESDARGVYTVNLKASDGSSYYFNINAKVKGE